MSILLDMESAIGRMGDKDIYIEVAHCFADNLESAIGALHAALMENNAATATRLAHSLKGNCATVGADDLKNQCFELEKTCKEQELEKALDIFNTLKPQLAELRSLLWTVA